MHIRLLFPIVLLLLTGVRALGQEGQFLDAYVFSQYSSINSYYDSYYGPSVGLGRDFDQPFTFSYGASIYYTKMDEGYVGFKTGIKYGKYSQYASSAVELADFDTIRYESQFSMDQFSIPLLLNFSINSSEEKNPVFFNMLFGFQLNYLSNGSFSVETDRPYDVVEGFTFRDYYRRVGVSYVLGVELKIALGRKEKTYLLLGIHYDESIGDIERDIEDFEPGTPSELIFPLGTLKDYDYNYSIDRYERYSLKNEALGLKLGISYRLSK